MLFRKEAGGCHFQDPPSQSASRLVLANEERSREMWSMEGREGVVTRQMCRWEPGSSFPVSFLRDTYLRAAD